MAELSAADKKVLNYKEPVVSAVTLAADKVRKRRNFAIGVAVLAALLIVAVWFGSQGIGR